LLAVLGWVGLGWVGSHEMDPWTTLDAAHCYTQRGLCVLAATEELAFLLTEQLVPATTDRSTHARPPQNQPRTDSSSIDLCPEGSASVLGIRSRPLLRSPDQTFGLSSEAKSVRFTSAWAPKFRSTQKFRLSVLVSTVWSWSYSLGARFGKKQLTIHHKIILGLSQNRLATVT